MRTSRACSLIVALFVGLAAPSSLIAEGASGAASGQAAPSQSPAALPTSVMAPTPAPAPAAASPSVPSLEAARKAALSVLAQPDAAARVSSLSDGLSPRDGLALLAEFAPKVGDPEGAKGLFARGGRLAILLGAYDVAADLLEAAAFKLPAARDDALLLRSARCRLASGDIDKAVDRAEIVLHSAAAPDLLLQARLVEAWAALLGGDMKKAGDTASDIVGKAPAKSDSRREARFIAWMAASGTAKGGAAAALIAEYPSSPEAAIASKAAVGGGKASANGADASAWAELLPATHWYLSGLVSTNPSPASPVPVSAPSVPATPVTPLPAASSPATPTPASPADSQAATTRRFQVGIFADAQNAADLISELAKKGFAARSEKRKVGTRDLIAVIVEGDPSTTSLKLKDSGYESYPLF